MSNDDEEGVILLGMWASPFSCRVRIALEEKGVKYEYQEMFLSSYRDDTNEILLQSNPIYENVPVLLHNGKPVIQSTNIMSYIDETWPNPPFMPSSPYGRSQARFWADYIDKKVFEGGARIWKGNADEVEVGKKEFIEILKCLEGGMGENDYFGGDSFGFVDISLIALTPWFLSYENYGGFKVEDHCPKISAWIKRCLKTKTVYTNLPDSELIVECVNNLRTVYDVDTELLDAWKLSKPS